MPIGSLIGAVASARGQDRANKSNERIARENRAFQERMSSTAHQRETKDLEAAGLNRILGISGKGSSTPGGAMATMGNVGAAGAEGAAKGASTAFQVKQRSLLEAQTTTTEKLGLLHDATARGLDAQLPRKAIIGDTITSARGQWDKFKNRIAETLRGEANIYGRYDYKKPTNAKSLAIDVPITPGESERKRKRRYDAYLRRQRKK